MEETGSRSAKDGVTPSLVIVIGTRGGLDPRSERWDLPGPPLGPFVTSTTSTAAGDRTGCNDDPHEQQGDPPRLQLMGSGDIPHP